MQRHADADANTASIWLKSPSSPRLSEPSWVYVPQTAAAAALTLTG